MSAKPSVHQLAREGELSHPLSHQPTRARVVSFSSLTLSLTRYSPTGQSNLLRLALESNPSLLLTLDSVRPLLSFPSLIADPLSLCCVVQDSRTPLQNAVGASSPSTVQVCIDALEALQGEERTKALENRDEVGGTALISAGEFNCGLLRGQAPVEMGGMRGETREGGPGQGEGRRSSARPELSLSSLVCARSLSLYAPVSMSGSVVR